MKLFLIGGLAGLWLSSVALADDVKTGALPVGGATRAAAAPLIRVAALDDKEKEKDNGKSPAPAGPPSITLYERHGHVTPHRAGFQHTGGGNVDVAQPTPDTLIITVTGAAVAGPHPCKDSTAAQDFDLSQCFELVMDKAEGKKIKVTMEARVIGLLRAPHHSEAVAEESAACATIAASHATVVTVCAPPHSVACGESLSINDHEGPVSVLLPPGRYTLQETFHVGVSCPHCLYGKAGSAEFAPDPAIDPLWISYWEPFHGANKKDFGFQVVIRVSPE
jgi:hypothetical protein